jgi:predicted dehydrogenase
VKRREFIRQGVLGTASLCLAGCRITPRKLSANEKLNIGVIGVANQGNYNLTNVATENIVALCDVDDTFLAAAKEKFPAAKTYNDLRRLLDQRDLDAVVVAIPDHVHAVATVAALKSGRHVYCEKPLTHTISECRIVMETARKMKRVTQIGTQIHAGNNYRRVVELVKTGAVGEIREVYVSLGGGYGGKKLPQDRPPVPANLHYDLWLGPVPYRPYSQEYIPMWWRNWWAFGGGTLSDFGCHYMDLPHWALDLRTPLSAEVLDGPPPDAESPPTGLMVRYEYPAREKQNLPPVTLTWCHGGKRPPGLDPAIAKEWNSGVLFVGTKGWLTSNYNFHALLPEKDFEGFVPPQPFIPNSIGHHQEWILACKTGGPTTCNFDYSGALTEAVLVGNVAHRAGCKIEWDSKNLRAKNCPAADEFIHHHYRRGWKI